MTKEELAAQLNGREYRRELTNEEAQLAAENNLVVVHGGSDDITMFAGAFSEECDANCDIFITEKFKLTYGQTDDDQTRIEEGWVPPAILVKVTSEFSPDEPTGATFLITADVPYASFDIMEEGNIYCRGIVFELPKAGESPIAKPPGEGVPIATPEGLVESYEAQIADLQSRLNAALQSAPSVAPSNFVDPVFIDPVEIPEGFASSQDATVWAQAFVGHIQRNPAIALDQETMVGWFANCMVAGETRR